MLVARPARLPVGAHDKKRGSCAGQPERAKEVRMEEDYSGFGVMWLMDGQVHFHVSLIARPASKCQCEGRGDRGLETAQTPSHVTLRVKAFAWESASDNDTSSSNSSRQ